MFKILYFEDTKSWQEVYRKAFIKAGIEIKILPNGNGNLVEEVLSFAPDLILLDICMPGRSGFDVAEILKKSKKTKSVPIFFFSALEDEETVKQGLSLGADKYLVKTQHSVDQVIEICKDFLAINNRKSNL